MKINNLLKYFGVFFQYGPHFDWNHKAQSSILGAYFWGYLVTPLLAGPLSEKFGGKNVIGVCIFLSSIVTFITPFLASNNFWPIFAARFVLGVLGVC